MSSSDKSVEKRSKRKSKKQKDRYGGHTPLASNELTFLRKERPEVIFIGAGQYGDLPVTDRAKRVLSEYETVILPTPEVLEKMEDEQRTYAAILHVTC